MIDEIPLLVFVVGVAAITLSLFALVVLLRPAPRLHIYDEHGNDLVYYCPGDARCNPTPWPASR